MCKISQSESAIFTISLQRAASSTGSRLFLSLLLVPLNSVRVCTPLPFSHLPTTRPTSSPTEPMSPLALLPRDAAISRLKIFATGKKNI